MREHDKTRLDNNDSVVVKAGDVFWTVSVEWGSDGEDMPKRPQASVRTVQVDEDTVVPKRFYYATEDDVSPADKQRAIDEFLAIEKILQKAQDTIKSKIKKISGMIAKEIETFEKALPKENEKGA